MPWRAVPCNIMGKPITLHYCKAEGSYAIVIPYGTVQHCNTAECHSAIMHAFLKKIPLHRGPAPLDSYPENTCLVVLVAKHPILYIASLFCYIPL